LGVPSWIQVDAEDWGRDLRKFEKKITGISGTMGRIAEEGPVGAAIRGFGDHLPDVDFSHADVQRFHLQWLNLGRREREILVMHYKEFGSIKSKLRKMNMRRNSYYNLIRETLCRMSAEAILYEVYDEQ
jgi:hypothetical protein